MPTTKEIYNEVMEVDKKLDQAQAEFDVADRELREIEEKNPELKDNELVEFRGFQIPRKEVRFIEEIEKQTGELEMGDTDSAMRIKIQDNKIKMMYLNNTQIKELTQPLPDSLEGLSLLNTQIKELTQPLPDSLEFLDLGNTQIKELTQSLPESLYQLNLHKTLIKELTQPLPDGLKVLSLQNTQIKEFTQPLPSSLESLSLDNTQIKELSQSLPDSLKEINIKSTPLVRDPQYKNALEDLIQRASNIPGLSLIYK